MNIDDILDDIEQYENNIDDLVANLKKVGVNNFDEFEKAVRENGANVKRSIRNQVAEKFANSEDDDWTKAQQIDTEEGYQNYLDSYPEGKHRSSARDRIEGLQKLAENSISDKIWENVNKTSISELQDFVDKNPQSTYYADATRILKNLRREQYLGVDIRALTRQIKAIRTDSRINDPEKIIYEKIKSYIDSGKVSIDALLEAIAEDNNFINGTVANLLCAECPQLMRYV